MDYTSVADSSINIDTVYDLGSDKEAKFGQMIRVKLSIYKGDSSKNAVYVWVEDHGERISKKAMSNLYERYKECSFTLPIQLYPNCDESYDDGDYDVVAEGLDTGDKYEIEVKGITSSLCEKVYVDAEEKEEGSGKFSYELVQSPEEIFVGEEFQSEVLLTGDNELHTISIWSYVYRRSKSYSGSREENKKVIYLNPGEIKEVTLNNCRVH